MTKAPHHSLPGCLLTLSLAAAPAPALYPYLLHLANPIQNHQSIRHRLSLIPPTAKPCACFWRVLLGGFLGHFEHPMRQQNLGVLGVRSSRRTRRLRTHCTAIRGETISSLKSQVRGDLSINSTAGIRSWPWNLAVRIEISRWQQHRMPPRRDPRPSTTAGYIRITGICMHDPFL